jgi:glyoxylase-like metal-dependent hydrolase (beta-lactamase superfamily II)
MELIRVADKTYYIKSDTNIGVYKTGENTVCIIDTGSKNDGEKIDEIIVQQGWTIDYIINTHTHIDHLGGNEYLMKKYNLKAYCAERDIPFAHFDEFEASFLNGGMPGMGLTRVFRHPGKIGFEPIEENEPLVLRFNIKILLHHRRSICQLASVVKNFRHKGASPHYNKLILAINQINGNRST